MDNIDFEIQGYYESLFDGEQVKVSFYLEKMKYEYKIVGRQGSEAECILVKGMNNN